jgi:hypothetical protein
MKTYQYDNKNRPNAIAPNHDDLLMADMISCYGLWHEPFISKYPRKIPDIDSMHPMQKHLHYLRTQREGDED